MEMTDTVKSTIPRTKTLGVHKITSNNRKNIYITGVTDVISFDLNQVLLETEYGMVTVKGQDLHVGKLSVDQGELSVDGRIDSLTYADTIAGKSKSIINRLFG